MKDAKKVIRLLEKAQNHLGRFFGGSSSHCNDYIEQALVILHKEPDKSIEVRVEEFIKSLQWDLRDSHNSSSCLNQKQRDFLKERLVDLLND